jgi:5-methylcytosine-specific restriction endonuclease McrA
MSQTPKANIPKALREQVWLTYVGRRYESKCMVRWCKNIMTVFDFHVGHDIPEVRGGATDISNLRPICSRCNLSMGSQYTIKEWEQLSRHITALSCCGV